MSRRINLASPSGRINLVPTSRRINLVPMVNKLLTDEKPLEIIGNRYMIKIKKMGEDNMPQVAILDVPDDKLYYGYLTNYNENGAFFHLIRQSMDDSMQEIDKDFILDYKLFNINLIKYSKDSKT